MFPFSWKDLTEVSTKISYVFNSVWTYSSVSPHAKTLTLMLLLHVVKFHSANSIWSGVLAPYGPLILVSTSYLEGQIPAQRPPFRVPHCPPVNIRPHRVAVAKRYFSAFFKDPQIRFEHRGSCSAEGFLLFDHRHNSGPAVALLLSDMF